jgi:hypothetical protein
MRKSFILVIFLVLSASFGCSSNNLRVKESTERVLAQLSSGDFDGIYDESDRLFGNGGSREEFRKRAERLMQEARKIDPALHWRVSEDEATLNNVAGTRIEDVELDFYATRRSLGAEREILTLTLLWVQRPEGEPRICSFIVKTDYDGENPIGWSSDPQSK